MRYLLATLWLTLACLGLVTAAENRPAPPEDGFFAFCIDTHDAKKRNLEQQAAMLKELGYDGVGHLWLNNVAERLKTLDAAGLRLYHIEMIVDLAPGKPAYDARFKDVVPLLKGRKVQVALLVNGMKPSDPAGDEKAVAILRELSDIAREGGVDLLLYPHTGSWVETIQDAVRVAAKTDRSNVNVMFNLCHWLRVSKDRDYRTAIQQALPRLHAISINGADEFDPQPGWSHYIQPLGRGTFDVCGFLKTVRELGYRGPIGLQCYGIGGDVQVHLAESMKSWKACQQKLETAKP